MRRRKNQNPQSSGRPKRERRQGDTFSMEEQRQLEKALRASLAETKSPQKVTPGPTITVTSSLVRPGRKPAVRDATANDCDEAECSSTLPVANPEPSPVQSKPTADRTYPVTEDFFTYLCFRDTDFMPKELKKFDDLPLERFAIKTASDSPMSNKNRRPLIITDDVLKDTEEVDQKHDDLDPSGVRERINALRKRLI